MSGAPSDVDPTKLHAGGGKKRRRKLRDRPDPPAQLKAGEAKALAAVQRLPLSPGILLEPRKDGERGWVNTAPHSDWDLWDLQLHQAFGTRSRSLTAEFLGALKRLCRSDWDEGAGQWKPNETDLNAAIAFIADIQPRNAIEAALAAQMFANNLVQMRLWKEAHNNGGMVWDKNAALASKLARTFTQQLEALRLMRGGKRPTVRQAITVKRETHYHQHQHLHDHRANPQAGGAKENEAQPHDPRAEAIEGVPPLLSDQSSGEVVRLPSDKGKACV